MKKFLVLLFAAAMLFAVSAMADTATQTVSGLRDAYLNCFSNIIAVRPNKDSGYILIDAQGNKIIDAEFNNVTKRDIYFQVQGKDEYINGQGAVDPYGNMVVPCEYTDIDSLSDSWVAAAHTVEGTDATYDFRVSNGSTTSFALIDRWDFYFKGTLVGSLDRTDYDYAYAYGDYLVIKNKKGEYTGYNSQMVPSSVAANTSSEYYSVRENGSYVYYHVGSGQKAFCAGCTLTKDEVSQYLMSDSKNNFYDLQGNKVFSMQSVANSVSSFYSDGYARITAPAGKGVINTQGDIVIPAVYQNIDIANGFQAGYVMVYREDGKFAFCDKQGNETCEFKYSSSVVSKHSNSFAVIQDLDGSLIIYTALGELSTRYANVSLNGNYHCNALVVGTSDKKAGIIGLNGDEILPLSASYRESGQITLSYDGSVAVVYNYDSRTYEIFSLSYDDAAAPVSQTAETAPATVQPAATSSDSNSWTCPTCNTQQTGNFCPNDGTKKPDDGSWICPTCGAKQTSNFCPNDGTKKPD